MKKTLISDMRTHQMYHRTVLSTNSQPDHLFFLFVSWRRMTLKRRIAFFVSQWNEGERGMHARLDMAADATSRNQLLSKNMMNRPTGNARWRHYIRSSASPNRWSKSWIAKERARLTGSKAPTKRQKQFKLMKRCVIHLPFLFSFSHFSQHLAQRKYWTISKLKT